MPVTITHPGTQGPRGNGILSGVGAPSSSTGVDGDYYGDITDWPASWILHGPKASGAWPAQTLTVTSGGVQLAGDLGGTSSSPEVTSTHLAAPLPIAQGGTGGTSQASAQAALGLGSAATQATSAFDAAGAASTAEAAAIADAATKYQPLQGWRFDVTTSAYGAKGDGQQVHDGVMGTGSAVLTSATASFTSNDVGKVIQVIGAGTTQSTTLVTTIASRQSATQVTLAAANASGSSLTNLRVFWGTDDTAAINSAVTAAFAHAQATGGIVVVAFPVPVDPAGHYAIGGALSHAHAGNAQIPLPLQPTTGNKVTIVFEGAGGNASAFQHWQQTTMQAGVTLLSYGVYANASAQTSDINANGNPSVIGGPTTANGYGASPGVFTNVFPIVKGLSVRNAHNGNGFAWGALDFYGCAEANLSDVALGTNGNVADGDYNNPNVFGSGSAIGLLMPAPGNNDDSRCQNVSILGGYTFAAFLPEHFVADRLAIINCWAAICPVGSYGGSVGSTHAINVGQASIENNANTVCVIGAGSGGIGPWLYGIIDHEGEPSFIDRFITSGVGLNALLGDVTLTGLFTPSAINMQSPTGLKIRNGQMGFQAASVTSNYQVTVLDNTILVDATSGPVTVTLISAAWTPNTYTVKKIDSSGNAVTIATTGGQTIDGASTLVLSSQWSKATLAPARVSGVWGWFQVA